MSGAALRKLAGYAASPALLARKAARAWRRRRALPSYREALARGELVEIPAAAPADVQFTVATPVYRVAEDHLRAAIASVRAQSHAGWELLLLDDASPDPHVARVLAEAAREDPRITVRRRASNGGIAVASDEIVAAARGAWVAFLDHDDLLHPRALEVAARALAADPRADWLFSDEDKVDEAGRHGEPCFKPAWSSHLLLSFNYVAHLRIVRRDLLARLGGHRRGLEGAQDYDLALRALATGARFRHLPGVLYHWRSVPGSMARAAGDKPAAHAHALRALAEHAAGWPRGGEIAAEVLLPPASVFRLRRRPESGLAVREVAAGLGWGAALAGALRRETAEVVVAPPARGLGDAATTELLALLQVPGTAVAAARAVRRGTVAASGWVAGDGGGAEDPWAGLAAADPGYLNLAAMPGPRAVPPPTAWAAWRAPLLAAWDAAPDVPEPWRLAAGLARLELAVVVTPSATVPARSAGAAPPPVPAEIWRYRGRWPRALGLAR